ncbi:hypothetical protein V1525DRAFT_393262 [Lipomyces kononenkoae]|uniref:Uncharacterized protein n=1 Tax=Lipomyces kononenkoae TaxID=34357 RepID=A0ACC3TBD7_LIPKO
MEMAATAFSTGISTQYIALYMECLNARVEAAIAVGAYRFAMQNAIEMISTNPKDPLGYIRQGKIYELLLEYAHAIAVYKEGLDIADTNAKFYKTLNSMHLAASGMMVMAGSSASGSADPTESEIARESEEEEEEEVDLFLKLPTEVLAKILSYVPTHDLFSFQRVSKMWQQIIQCTPKLWHTLDFAQTNPAVPLSAIQSGLGYAGGHVNEILISNIVHKDANAFMELQMPFEDAPVWLRRIRRFRADFCLRFFSDWRYLGDWHQDPFRNFEELRIRFENSPEVVDMFALGQFPKLRVLDCYATYDIVKSYDAVTYLNAHRVKANTVRVQPQLRVLRLGGPTKIKDLFPYIWESKTYVSTVKGIERLLKLTPNLEEFHCINIRYGDGHQHLDVYEDGSSWAQRLNLRGLLPNLKVCNLDRSDLGGMPVLPDSCESLYLDSDTCPRLWYRTTAQETGDGGGGGMVMDNTDTAEFRMGVPMPSTVAVDSQLWDEYRNIRELFVFGLARSDRLIDRLARFDQHKLTSLNISFCKIDWSNGLHVSEDRISMYMTDFSFHGLRHNGGYVSEVMCDMFPNLVRLGVAHTDLNDKALGSFARLEQLEYIDISGNVQVTADGVTRFLTRDESMTAAELPRPSMSARRDREDQKRFERCCRLKTLVASYCFIPADVIQSWAGLLGVNVRMDLIALRDSDWLLSDVKNGNKHVLYEDVTESHWYARDAYGLQAGLQERGVNAIF